ncbi:MAG: hypothetical protein B7Y39_04350 [Bdellovibrio sp. 28-41-41]|nr:MAG: hypothetical protein B7Y39_04350 [Bdellovibrio sp. 28-41-41]
MSSSFFIFIVMFSALSAYSLEGIDGLSKNLYQKNQEIMSLEKYVESKEALSNSSVSGYYPTLNAVAGWGQNKTDDLPSVQKGYLGYIEGRLNLFRGFKDHSIRGQKDIDFLLSKLDLESKKRELRLQLTEISSRMILHHKIRNILDEEFKVTQSQKQMAAKKVGAGLTGTVDNLEFELRENELQIAQRQIDQQHDEAHQRFFKMFGEDVSDAQLENLEFSSVETLAKAAGHFKVENALEYRKIELAQNRSEFEKKEIKADFLPSLDFTYGFGRLTPSEESNLKFNESRYAIQITIPIFSGFDTYYRSKSVNLVSQSIEKLKTQKRIDIGTEFNILRTKIAQMNALYQINEKKQISSQKYFDLTLSEYRRGIKNSPDLVSATERLFSSKKKKYEILVDLEILKVQIENLY